MVETAWLEKPRVDDLYLYDYLFLFCVINIVWHILLIYVNFSKMQYHREPRGKHTIIGQYH